jgi:hypothetical protein
MSNTIVTRPDGHPTAASNPAPAAPTTHEAFIHAVRAIVLPRVADTSQRARLAEAKLVYGAGHAMGARGVTFYGASTNGMPGHDFLEVCAAGEETTVQLAGTTIHELAHCLAGNTAGHASEWKAACKTLGLIHAEAAGQSYAPEHFAADVWAAISAFPTPDDGRPTFANRGRGPGMIAGPATLSAWHRHPRRPVPRRRLRLAAPPLALRLRCQGSRRLQRLRRHVQPVRHRV